MTDGWQYLIPDSNSAEGFASVKNPDGGYTTHRYYSRTYLSSLLRGNTFMITDPDGSRTENISNWHGPPFSPSGVANPYVRWEVRSAVAAGHPDNSGMPSYNASPALASVR